jgi:hypothetical protein
MWSKIKGKLSSLSHKYYSGGLYCKRITIVTKIINVTPQFGASLYSHELCS